VPTGFLTARLDFFSLKFPFAQPMDKKSSVRPAVCSNESAAGQPESNNDASGITLLLADHEIFGFSERCVCANI